MMEKGWKHDGSHVRTLALWDDPADTREIEVYLPERRGPETWTAVVCPGGGYGYRAWHEGPGTAVWLAMHGIAAAVVPYLTTGDSGAAGGGEGGPLHPRPLRDVCRAVRVVRDHAGQFGLNAKRVATVGFSAGGHAAGSAALLHAETDASDPLADTWSGRPDAAALIYPVVSMIPPCHDGSWRNLLGSGASLAQREAMSLQTRVTADCPPLFIVHTADDPIVPLKGATDLAGAARKAGVRAESHVWDDGGHGYGLALDRPGVGKWTGLMLDWFRALS